MNENFIERIRQSQQDFKRFCYASPCSSCDCKIFSKITKEHDIRITSCYDKFMFMEVAGKNDIESYANIIKDFESICNKYKGCKNCTIGSIKVELKNLHEIDMNCVNIYMAFTLFNDIEEEE